MKVTKHGKHYSKMFRGKCVACECAVEASFTEVFRWNGQAQGIRHYVRCPECGADFLWVEPITEMGVVWPE